MLRMPGKSYQGPMPPLTEEQRLLREILRRDVYKLAGEIGDRNVKTNYENLCATADFIEASFQQAGFKVRRQGYEVSLRGLQGRMCYNLEVEITGSERSGEIVVIGGHYDSLEDTPGANDNASGTAAVLALARAFASKQTLRTLRFVMFVNEEPPYFQSKDMGSWVYVKQCRQRNENIVAMLSLETIGYYSDEKWSQNYPVAPLSLVYPTTGNFIAFVGNIKSRKLVRDVVGLFRRYAEFPSEAAVLPERLVGVGWSDQWAFWQGGYPGVMVTDTAPFRYPYYHTQEDTPDKIDYDRLAYVVSALEGVVAGLAGCRHKD
ncbi:MAG: M28 family peptidase [Candidatus Brocadia sp.]|nr:M28 family peptidase [Candidatus Brocadia sp.]